jgi:hypothetical protein
VSEAALSRVEVDGCNTLSGLKERNGDVHGGGRLSGTTLLVAEDDDMRRTRLARIRLHQHGNATPVAIRCLVLQRSFFNCLACNPFGQDTALRGVS